MKKSVYIICLCVLSVLVFSEWQRVWDGSETVTVFNPSQNQKDAVGRENKVAYLTFDDGPSRNTEKILKILKEKKAVATFFLIGNEITAEREKIIKKAVEGKNAIGVHTYCHEKDVIYCDAQCFMEDFEQASAVIKKITGVAPMLHRFPWGSNNGYVSSYVDELHEKLKTRGVKSFDWNVSGEDSVGRNIPSNTIFKNVKKDLDKYRTPIILLHDSAAVHTTVEALPEIIDYIQEKGYTFDTLENREEYLFPASWR